MSKLTDKIAAISAPVVERNGCTLWDVEYLKEGGQRYLRVYIDNPDGITLEHCEKISRELDPLIDELDPIEESYLFEVSSAGAERALKRPQDFELCRNRLVLVKLYSARDGKKEFVGKLTDYTDDGTVELDGSLKFEKKDVALVRLTLENWGV